jgi:hypothetical protein
MYKFKPPPPPPSFDPLHPGDYSFEVVECGSPYQSSAGNLVLPLKLAILPDRVAVYSNPWCGTDKNGGSRDGIAEFLLCVGRAPREGQEPDWTSMVGAKGKCHLKLEVAQAGKLAGQQINTVGWFHRPQEVVPVQQGEQFPQKNNAKWMAKA